MKNDAKIAFLVTYSESKKATENTYKILKELFPHSEIIYFLNYSEKEKQEKLREFLTLKKADVYVHINESCSVESLNNIVHMVLSHADLVLLYNKHSNLTQDAKSLIKSLCTKYYTKKIKWATNRNVTGVGANIQGYSYRFAKALCGQRELLFTPYKITEFAASNRYCIASTPKRSVRYADH